MSIAATHEIACACGAAVTVQCCDTINAERQPELREALLARVLHVFACQACGAHLRVEKPVMYLDLDRGLLCLQVPETEGEAGGGRTRARERAAGEQLLATWHASLGDQAPAAVAVVFGTHRFQARICFGLEELREKVVCRESGLSDLALEAVKCELLAAHPDRADWAAAGVRTLRLDHVEPDGRLAFFLERATDPPTVLAVGLVVARDRYDELAATPWRALLERHPLIASGPHVSTLRLAMPEVLAEAAHEA